MIPKQDIYAAALISSLFLFPCTLLKQKGLVSSLFPFIFLPVNRLLGTGEQNLSCARTFQFPFVHLFFFSIFYTLDNLAELILLGAIKLRLV